FRTWILAALAISTLLMWLALRGVHLGDVAEELRHADLGLVVVGMVLVVTPYPVGALRWRVIARSMDPPGTGTMMELTFVGAATTNALPGRLGEPVRGFGLARMTGRPFMQGMGTVFVDRFCDVIFACFCLGATIGAVTEA